MGDEFEEIISKLGVFYDPAINVAAWDINQVSTLMTETSLLLQEWVGCWLIDNTKLFPRDGVRLLEVLRVATGELLEVLGLELLDEEEEEDDDE